MKESQKRFLGAMLATSSVLGVVAPAVTTMASVKDETEADIHELRDVINENLPKLKKDPKFSTFHKILYAADRLRIYHNLGYEADRVMDEIGVYSKQVHKPEIISVIDKMNKFSEAKKMQMYDDLLQKDIPALEKIDADAAQYLTERLDSWGTAVVFDFDLNYSKATDAIMQVTKSRKDGKKSEALKKIDVAKKAIKDIKTFKENGKYLNEKLQVEIDLVNKMSSGGGGGGSSVGVDVREARDAVANYESYVKNNIINNEAKVTVEILAKCQELEDKANKSVRKLEGSEHDLLNNTIQENKDKVIEAGAKTTNKDIMKEVVKNADNKALGELKDSNVQDAIINKVITNQKDGQEFKNQEEFNKFVNEAIKDVAVDYASDVKTDENVKTVLEIVKSVDEGTKEALSKLEKGVTQDLIAQELLAQLGNNKNNILGDIAKASKAAGEESEFSKLTAKIKEVVKNVNDVEVAVKGYELISPDTLKVTVEGVKGAADIREKAETALKEIKTVDGFNKRIKNHKDELEKVRDLVKKVNDAKKEDTLFDALKALGAEVKEYNKKAYLDSDVNDMTNKKDIIDYVKEINEEEAPGTAIKVEAVNKANDKTMGAALKAIGYDKFDEITDAKLKEKVVAQFIENMIVEGTKKQYTKIKDITTDLQAVIDTVNAREETATINAIKTATAGDEEGNLVQLLQKLLGKTLVTDENKVAYEAKVAEFNVEAAKETGAKEAIKALVDKVNKKVTDEADLNTKIGKINNADSADNLLAALKGLELTDVKDGNKEAYWLADNGNFKTLKDVTAIQGKVKEINDKVTASEAELKTKIGKVNNADSADNLLAALKGLELTDVKDANKEAYWLADNGNFKTLKDVTAIQGKVKEINDKVTASEAELKTKIGKVNNADSADNLLTALKGLELTDVKDENKEAYWLADNGNFKTLKDVTAIQGKVKEINNKVTSEAELKTKIEAVNKANDKEELFTKLTDLGIKDLVEGNKESYWLADNGNFKTLKDVKEIQDKVKEINDKVTASEAELKTKIGKVNNADSADNLLTALKGLELTDVKDENKEAYWLADNGNFKTLKDVKEIQNKVKEINDKVTASEAELKTKIGKVNNADSADNLLTALKGLELTDVKDGNKEAYWLADNGNFKTLKDVTAIQGKVTEINRNVEEAANAEQEKIEAVKTAGDKETLFTKLTDLGIKNLVKENKDSYYKEEGENKNINFKTLDTVKLIQDKVDEINNKVTSEAELKEKIEAVKTANDKETLFTKLTDLGIKNLVKENKDAYYKEEGENKNINFKTLDTVKLIQDKVDEINNKVTSEAELKAKIEAVKTAKDAKALVDALNELGITNVKETNKEAYWLADNGNFSTLKDKVAIQGKVTEINRNVEEAVNAEQEKIEAVKTAGDKETLFTKLTDLGIKNLVKENKDAYYKEEGENKNINFKTLDTVKLIQDKVDEINNKVTSEAELKAKIEAVKTAKDAKALVDALNELGITDVKETNKEAYWLADNGNFRTLKDKVAIQGKVTEINRNVEEAVNAEQEKIEAVKTAGDKETLFTKLTDLGIKNLVKENKDSYYKEEAENKNINFKTLDTVKLIQDKVDEINNKVTSEAELKAKIEAVNNANDKEELFTKLTDLGIKDLVKENKDAYYKEEGENKNINFKTLDTVKLIQDKVDEINNKVTSEAELKAKIEAVNNANDKEELFTKLTDPGIKDLVKENKDAYYKEEGENKNINFKTLDTVKLIQDKVDEINNKVTSEAELKTKIEAVNKANDKEELFTKLTDLGIKDLVEGNKESYWLTDNGNFKTLKDVTEIQNKVTEINGKVTDEAELKTKIGKVNNADSADNLLIALKVLNTEETKVVNDDNAVKYFENIDRFKTTIEKAENTEAAKTEIIKLVGQINKEITDAAKPENTKEQQTTTVKSALIKDYGKAIGIPSVHENSSENTTCTITSPELQK